MATLTVHVTDDTFRNLLDQADARAMPMQVAAGRILHDHFRLFDGVPVDARVVLLHGDGLRALETILSGGSVLSQADLITKVQRLAGISFAHVRLDFTPGQLETVQRKAEGSGLTVHQLVERMAPKILDQFFGLVPP